FLVAPNAGFTGTFTGGGGFATMSISGDLRIGNNTTAAAAGVGIFEIQGGIAVSSAQTIVGDPDGGTGTLKLTGAGTLTTGGLTIDAAHGVLQHDTGQIRVIGGPCVLATPGLTLNGAAASDVPTLNIESGGTMTLTSG